jgi:hypothetical protein
MSSRGMTTIMITTTIMTMITITITTTTTDGPRAEHRAGYAMMTERVTRRR